MTLLEGRAAGVLLPAALAVLLIAGCSHVPGGRRGEDPGHGLARIAEETRRVERIEGRGKATVENRLGRIDMEFEMTYEPGGALEIDADLAPGLLPFHGDVRIMSTPDTTVAYANGVPLVASGTAYPGRSLYPALVSICLGGDWVLGWLEARGCRVAAKVDCGGLAFEFDVDEGTGHVKTWFIEREEPDGAYDGFLYRSRPSGRLQLPEILTGMVHPLEASVYVEYYEIDVTMR